MPDPVALCIEPRAVADIQPLHCPAGIGTGRLYYQVIMIAKQHIRMNTHAISLCHLRKQFQKVFIVTIGKEYLLTFYPPGRNMIPAILDIYS